MTDPIRLLVDPEAAQGLQADLRALAEHPVAFDVTTSLSAFEARLEQGDASVFTDEELDDAARPEGPEEAAELGSNDLEALDSDDLESFDPDAIEPSGMVAKPPPGPPGAGVESAAGQGVVGQGVAQGSSQLTAGKLLAVLALGAGVGWGALHLTSAQPVAPPAISPSRVSENARVEPSEPRATAPELSSPPSEPEGAADVIEAPREPRAAETSTRTPHRRPQPVPTSTPEPSAAIDPPIAVPVEPAAPSHSADADDSLQRELAQLGEVRRALTTDPKRALHLANRGHQEFGEGALFQEREALALRALGALGDREGLESRGRAFLLRYPKSSFAREVERMLRK